MNVSPILVALMVVSVFFMFFCKTPKQRDTLRGYFWGGNSLKTKNLVVLMISTSFSVNGVLYQTWLAYNIGWSAIIIQVIFCVGYVFMALQAKRIGALLSKGTLHGIIAEVHGPAAGTLASIASVIGFCLLIGWEFMCGANITQAAAPNSVGFGLVAAVILAAIGAIYSAMGGLRSNAKANHLQNIVAAVGMIICIIWFFTAGGTGPINPDNTSSLSKIIPTFGWTALWANIAFSALWQFCDMSNWQTMSGLGDDRKKLGKGLYYAAFGVLLLPGVVGTALGIALSGNPGMTDSGILAELLVILSGHQWILAFIFSAAMFCAFLSTLDGYFLASTQTVVWDLLKKKDVKQLLSSEEQAASPRELKILGLSRGMVFVIAAVALGITCFLYYGLGIGLFTLVYVVTVAQLSLSGAVITTIFNLRKGNGFTSITLGLATGFGFLVFGLVKNVQWALELAGVAAIVGSFVGLLVPKRASN